MRSRVLLAVLVALLALPAVASGASAKGKDQVVITGSITVAKDQRAHTVVIVDGPARIDGHVTGDVVVVSGRLTISGQVDGDVVAVSQRAHILAGAHLGGDLTYGDEKPVVAPGATVDGKVSKQGLGKVSASAFGWALGIFLWVAVTLAAVVLGLLLVALAPRAVEAAWEGAESSLGAAIGMGVGLFVGLPIIAILIAVTVLGLPLAFLLFLAVLPLYALGYVTSAWILGRRILSGPRDRFVPLLVGLLILRVVALIPVLGGLTGVAATAFGLGALALAAWRAGGTGRRPAAAAPPATS